MVAAGGPQQKVACSHNAYHSQTERDIDRNQERVKENTTFMSTANTVGDPGLCMPSLYI